MDDMSQRGIPNLRAGTLMAVRFDARRLEVAGAAVALVEGVLTSTDNTGSPQAAFSEPGSLAYVPGDRRALDRTLAWLDRKGAEEEIPRQPRFFAGPRVSPDGQGIVLNINEGNKSDLWLYDVLHGTLTGRTFDGFNSFPFWTRDGKRIVFQGKGRKRNQRGLVWITVDGSDSGESIAISDYNPGTGFLV